MTSNATLRVLASFLILMLAPLSATAQIASGPSLQGDWVRSDSNYDPNDTMRIAIQGAQALLTAVPASVVQGFAVGQVLWRKIQSNGTLEVLGNNGSYYPAQLTFQGPDVVHVDIHHTAAGNDQTWTRAGPSIAGDWVRIAAPGTPDDGVQVRVAGNQASVRYLPATAPRSLRVGSKLWQNIGGNTLQVLGRNGSYYQAQFTLIGTDRLRIDSNDPRVGSGLIWVRPRAVNAARLALAGPVTNPNTPGSNLQPPGGLPTVPGVPAQPGPIPGACLATSLPADQMGTAWGFGLSSPTPNDAIRETLGIWEYKISDFQGALKTANVLTDLERVRVPGMQDGFAFVWQPVSRPRRYSWAEHRDLTAAQFDQQDQTHRTAGLRASDIEVYQTSAGMRYSGVWVENPEGVDWSVKHGQTGQEYGQTFQQLSGTGYRLVDMEAYQTPSGLRYAAIWYKSCDNSDWRQWRGMDRTAYQNRTNSQSALGFQVIDFESYQTSGGQRYAAIWQKIPAGRAWAVRSGRDLNGFLNFHRQYVDEGFRLIDFESYDTQNGIRYAGVWAENDRRYDFAFKPEVDDSVTTFRSRHAIPGISVVVMQNDEVIYRRGFGWADSLASKRAHSGTMYLSASVAKVFGGTLAARLKQQGRMDSLSKATTFFLPNLPAHHTHTVEQLLSKTGCVWHYTQGPEPVEQYYRWRDSALAQMQDSLVDQNGNNRLLLNCTPGQQYHYSSHGFTFVGAVLEAVLGKDIHQIITDELTVTFGLPSLATMGSTPVAGPTGPVPYFDMAQGYWYNPNTGLSQPIGYDDSSWKVLGGGLQLDPIDLARFGWLTLNGTIVSPTVRDNRLWASLTTGLPQWSGTSTVPQVGLAWELRMVNGRNVAEHGGSWAGARSHLAIHRDPADPDQGLVIAILSNQRNGPLTPGPATPRSWPARNLARAIAQAILANPPPP
jgi:CubicO group peptidase (beta-lactamase class C family)